MNNFETVIGIEIHIELNTKTKMFSSAPNDFHAEPNTNASLIDVGYPGTLPQLNKAAVEKAIMLAKALNMKIDDQLHFDRKNYFYPDIPKGFQITQNERPIGSDGILPIVDNKVINIERIHLEEDTARSNHEGDNTTLDYNRAGTPLIEIVSHPEIRSAEEAISYISTIRNIAKILDISDAKMEEGSLRADINLSLRPYGQTALGTKVEIKNINSLSNVEKAIEREIAHQTESYLNGTIILQSTKRFDEGSQDVITMRDKTDAADYRYFAEPNIPVIQLEKSFIDNISIPELPWQIEKRMQGLDIDNEYVKQLIIDPVKLNFINKFNDTNIKQAIKLYFAEVVSFANNKKINLKDIKISSEDFSLIIEKLNDGEISGSHVKKIIPILIETKKDVASIIEDNNLKQISNISILEPMLDKIIKDNKDFVDINSNRPERVSKFILGQLMKESRGQANPVVANKLVSKKLGD